MLALLDPFRIRALYLPVIPAFIYPTPSNLNKSVLH